MSEIMASKQAELVEIESRTAELKAKNGLMHAMIADLEIESTKWRTIRETRGAEISEAREKTAVHQLEIKSLRESIQAHSLELEHMQKYFEHIQLSTKAEKDELEDKIKTEREVNVRMNSELLRLENKSKSVNRSMENNKVILNGKQEEYNKLVGLKVRLEQEEKARADSIETKQLVVNELSKATKKLDSPRRGCIYLDLGASKVTFVDLLYVTTLFFSIYLLYSITL
jgi:ribosomal protein L12E/L44/L45/RPP1/RPP2